MLTEEYINKDLIQNQVADKIAKDLNAILHPSEPKVTKEEIIRIKHLQSRVIKLAIDHGYVFNLTNLGKFYPRRLSKKERETGFDAKVNRRPIDPSLLSYGVTEQKS